MLVWLGKFENAFWNLSGLLATRSCCCLQTSGWSRKGIRRRTENVWCRSLPVRSRVRASGPRVDRGGGSWSKVKQEKLCTTNLALNHPFIRSLNLLDHTLFVLLETMFEPEPSDCFNCHISILFSQFISGQSHKDGSADGTFSLVRIWDRRLLTWSLFTCKYMNDVLFLATDCWTWQRGTPNHAGTTWPPNSSPPNSSCLVWFCGVCFHEIFPQVEPSSAWVPSHVASPPPPPQSKPRSGWAPPPCQHCSGWAPLWVSATGWTPIVMSPPSLTHQGEPPFSIYEYPSGWAPLQYEYPSGWAPFSKSTPQGVPHFSMSTPQGEPPSVWVPLRVSPPSVWVPLRVSLPSVWVPLRVSLPSVWVPLRVSPLQYEYPSGWAPFSMSTP